jgi:hypothetical protein
LLRNRRARSRRRFSRLPPLAAPGRGGWLGLFGCRGKVASNGAFKDAVTLLLILRSKCRTTAVQPGVAGKRAVDVTARQHMRPAEEVGRSCLEDGSGAAFVRSQDLIGHPPERFAAGS